MKPTVLIVDDDALLLRALDRALRRRASEWDVTLVDGGALAERCLESGRFDVVVTDLRMREPGTQVLACARRKLPRAVRVMMTGDRIDARDVDAHVVLEKPMTLATFETMLEAAVAVAQLLAG